MKLEFTAKEFDERRYEYVREKLHCCATFDIYPITHYIDDLRKERDALNAELTALRAQNAELKTFIKDLRSWVEPMPPDFEAIFQRKWRELLA